ncbi:MAG: bifunctional folylpolyglutamate synthase/dihydrofolate synthase [Lachnospiraceae bacterium]|nr:bifunctional folylpolyglutamate synthase/dihydrofolate synthase [Lachnospiraceae bacterium]MDD3617393.1 bifunctional folylpolyglutamate synthase/dihydrofolate synthase [Lachnospiraceae bacterium]
MNYREAEQYIADIPKFTTKNKPEHTKDALRRLGNPENNFKVLHVAGTNGKGSVCAFLSSALVEAGCRTGLFISPHLVKVNERFQINNEMITDEEFLSGFNRVKEIADEMVAEGEPHPTYFEFLFLMGMEIFRSKGVEYAVLETGLGGRLDATNTIEHPLISVIASISLDHTEILGDTIEEIAGEKAGIIKNQIPVVYNCNQKKVEQVIEQKASSVGSKTWPLRQPDYQILENTAKGIDFSFNTGYYGNITVHIPYIAAYQVENAALAFLTLLTLRDIPEAGTLKERLTVETIKNGFEKVRWQGRMETILPQIIVDGAHNEDGITRFLETAEHFSKKYPLTLLFSAVIEKNYKEMIHRIVDRIQWNSVVVTQINGSRVVPAKELGEIFTEFGCSRVLTEPNVEQAFELARKEKKDGLLFCAGSLYLVGEIKEYLESKEADHD